MTISGIKRKLPPGGVMMLVAVNAVVIVALTLIGFFTRLSGHEVYAAAWLDVPPGTHFIERPWTLLTYMITQTDIWHAIFNMLWLYWFGVMYQNLTSPRRLVKLYIAAGLCGAAFYIAGSLVWPASAGLGLEGASAAVMGVVTATACLIPDYRMNLLLFGPVKIKWIAIVTIAIFAFGLTGNNSGAHIAHIGGVITGLAWVFVPRLKSARYKSGRSSAGALSEADARAELDALLDKVRRSGYASLTADERRRMFDLSKRV